jgi:hypothetical protein
MQYLSIIVKKVTISNEKFRAPNFCVKKLKTKSALPIGFHFSILQVRWHARALASRPQYLTSTSAASASPRLPPLCPALTACHKDVEGNATRVCAKTLTCGQK